MMSYKRADQVLPQDIILLIQQYIDGDTIYIPRKEDEPREWGKNSSLQREMKERNQSIYEDYNRGLSTLELADKYFLSQKSIQRIVLQYKRANINKSAS